MNEDTVDGLASAIVDSSAVEGGFLLGYVVIAEWMNPEGNRVLSSSSASGSNEDIPPWQARGYLNEVLNHWDFQEPEEEE